MRSGASIRLSRPASARASLPAEPAILAAAFAAVTIWAATPIVTKVAVDVFDPLLVAMMRSVLAGVVLIPVIIFGRRVPLPRDRRGWGLLLTSSLSGFVAFPILISLGLRHTTASHVALIQMVQPIFTGLIAAVTERRWLGRFWALGCALAVIGEVAMIGFRFGLSSEGGVVGDLLVLASTICASLAYVAGSHCSRRIGTWAATLWGNVLAGGVLLAPLLLLARHVSWAQVGFAVWGSVSYLAIFSSVIGYIAWYWALARGGVARMGATQFAMPVMTLMLAALLLGERVTLPLVLSGAAILLGVWLTQRRPPA
ncbi:MAG TPA: DMT family transporter [Alphaproteobacteria bacterium]|nr:DMT family transporter [Alphaproteobacteria bacterium]